MIVKTSEKDYLLFKKEIKYWIDFWELNNWKIAFEWKELSNADAKCNPSLKDRTCTFALAKNIGGLENGLTHQEYIKISAKHEVLHLLIARVTELGHTRFLTFDDIIDAEEELILKLEKYNYKKT